MIDEATREKLQSIAEEFESRVNVNRTILRPTEKYRVGWNVSRRVGNHAIEPFEVTAEEALRFNVAQASSGFARYIAPGRYTRLVEYIDAVPEDDRDLVGLEYGVDGGRKPYRVWMSDTQAEVSEHLESIAQAKMRGGHCLVTGLGIGMVANAMLMEGAETVTVLEIDRDIVELVEPLLVERWGNRIRVVLHDAMRSPQVPPGTEDHWTVVWHDIWPTISSKNLPEMKRLTELYASHCDWQGCWDQDICEKMAHIEKISDAVEVGTKALAYLPRVVKGK